LVTRVRRVSMRSKRPSDRAFGIVISVVLAVIGLWPLTRGGGVMIWPLGFAAVFLVTALVRPAILQPLKRIWIKLGLPLARIVGPVLMAVWFYFIVTPVGITRQLKGNDPSRLRLGRLAETGWIEPQPLEPASETMVNQF